MSYQIIAFYEFLDLSRFDLADLKASLKQELVDHDVRGTLIIAHEGYNGMLCGVEEDVARFTTRLGAMLGTTVKFKSSFHGVAPFRKQEVKIKPEIVTLKKSVDIALGKGTHVSPQEWNRIIDDPETIVLDTRNDYEYKTGTFRRAVNPATEKFSELPDFVAENLDPDKHKRVAMFCTGGIRCEKFAPYMKQLGFEEVYQLEGGILKYLEETPEAETRWEGECFVFDERITVNSKLEKGVIHDHSLRSSSRRKEKYKLAE